MTWTCGASTARPCAPAGPPPERVEGGSRGAGAPCARPLARGHRHQDPPGARRVRPAARLHAHSRAAARADRLQTDPGSRAPVEPAKAPRTRPKHLAGDKAYSYRPVFAYLRQRRIKPVIPPRRGGHMGKGCPRSFDPDLTAGATPSSAARGGRKAAVRSPPTTTSSRSTSPPW